MAGLYSPSRSGRSIPRVRSVVPASRIRPTVVAASRGLGLGSRCRFAFIGGGRMLPHGWQGISTIGAASFSVRSTSLVIVRLSPVALLSACEFRQATVREADSGKAASSRR